MVQTLLHGVLHATIYEIDRLPIGLSLHLLSQPNGPRRMWKTLMYQAKGCCSCDPQVMGYKIYVSIDLDKARVARTRMISRPSHARWSESFHIYCAHQVSNIIFTIKDDNPIGATLIGRAYLPVEEIIQGRAVDRWLDIRDDSHAPIHSKVHVRLHYIDITRDPNWSQGIKNPQFRGVPFTFFRQRRGCKVTLYQDAHVMENFMPDLYLSGGQRYEPKRCWEDIFDAIVNAKHLIYIAGWSVYTKITLVRDPNRPKPAFGELSLGELLIKKANDGVRVLVLIWDDRASNRVLKEDFVMATHDEETADYFRKTKVHCALCPRNPDDGKSIVQWFQIGTIFTHHQKTVVVDSENPGGRSQKRRIVSFVGGIDLCDGRYDMQTHSLFRTLNTVHRDDFHQPNFPGSSIKKGGPREPWHDIHCCLEGPVAWDVLYNFEQRWRKQAGNQIQHLFSIKELDQLINPPSEITLLEDPETWNVQLFRSIDGGAVLGFPEDPDAAAEVGLVSGKDSVVDRSIQDAYINAIRRAKNFIYIENQYFLGSSFGWKSEDIKVEDIGALHLIPKEISLKIISKIEAGERFSVYIVIPMWPEGVPESGSVQAILDWQRRTMEMMYTDIADALARKGVNGHPRDYLSFFCLGNREMVTPGEYVPSDKPEPDTDYSRAQHSRRFMIYVHAKMMIVDDEYIIIGSANTNQRSMDGARDSEIAMGAYQPHHLSTRQPTMGQIFGFRMALWYEHIGTVYTTFLEPETLECMHDMNEIAGRNWNLYSSDVIYQNLPGQLLRYPVEVTSYGHIMQLPGLEFFPDTKARVLGAKSDILPPILTT